MPLPGAISTIIIGSVYAEQSAGLPGQGIDPNDGLPVGGYVVR